MSEFVPCTPNGAAFWQQRTALDGVDFLLTFRWNQRDGHWLLDVADIDGVAIRSGMLLALGLPLLLGCVDARRPAGELVVIDTAGVDDLDPGFDDLGTRFAVMYINAAELA